jgi:hypothetical protein
MKEKREQKKKREKITPGEYFKLLEGFQIKGIDLVSCRYSINKNKIGIGPRMTFSAQSQSSFSLDNSKKMHLLLLKTN